MLLKFSGFGPLSLVDSGPGVFLARLGVLGKEGGAWREVPWRESGDSYSLLFAASRRTVYIKLKSNNNLIGVGCCSLAWSIAIFCDFGASAPFGRSLVIIWRSFDAGASW